MTFTDRYTPFPNLTTHKYVLPLTDLQMNDYFITETILNRNNGSAFDKWIDLGALPLETSEEVEYLKSISVPRIQKSHCKIEDGKTIISRTLEPTKLD